MSDGRETHTGSEGRDDTPRHRYTAALANELEPRWQRAWDEAGAFRARNPGEPGFDASKPKAYILDMFPYPSGAGLHVGHPEGYTATDILARFRRMQGFNVLHPMGWDAFGLPAEQYAVEKNIHPRVTTQKAIDTFRRQLKRFGFSYDWSREISTIDPGYYKWTQWIWLRLYNAWYDPRVNDGRGGARPIESLLDDLANERLLIAPDGGVVEVGAGSALGSLGGEPAGGAGGGLYKKWVELADDQRRAVIEEQRLAYQGEQTVNWCPALGTVLANEEVIDGRSERGGHPVRRVALKQWMFRITSYAERLLDDLALVDWPESTRTQQADWIGRSEGAEIDFELKGGTGSGGSALRVFTTRPDTLFGATYMVVAPEHELLEELITPDQRAAARRYLESIAGKSDVERQETKEKTGVFSGSFAKNPATGEDIPVWIAEYVLTGYGTGAIMAVPAHDERDFEFARRHALPVRPVVRPPDDRLWARVESGEERFTGDGVAVNSRSAAVSLDGLPTREAKKHIIDWLEREGLGERKINYKLRDWLFSRQRYWGEPFPVVYDDLGHAHALAPSDLPVELPEMDDFKPVESDTPVPPLGKAKHWASFERGGRRWRRETNTMPNWAGSCWYYLRYCDPRNGDRFTGVEAERYWMGQGDVSGGDASGGGVDLYMGGAEHAVLHLLYARFWHKALFDLGEVSSPEPFKRLRHQGLILSFAYQRADGTLVPSDQVEERADGAFVETATGEPVSQIVAKMSKSLKNVVNPDDVIAEFGADTFRLYEMAMGPIEASKPWNPRDIVGLFRFLQRLWRVAVDEESGALRLLPDDRADAGVERALHRTIRKVGQDIDALSFNTAIAAMIEWVNEATRAGATRDQLARFARTLSPFAPHIAEELWSRLGHAGLVCNERWPSFDAAALVEREVELAVQVNGKVRGKVTVPADADDQSVQALALADDKVREALGGKPPRRIVVVRGRLINIVL